MFNRTIIIILVNLIFFEVGLMVAVIGSIIPDIIKSFNLSLTAASYLPLSYYLSFAVLAIPAGLFIEKYSYKKVLLTAYSLGIIGIFLFAFFQNYPIAILSLFLIGCSLTVAQVAVFPLLREACGAEKLPFHSTFNQFLYGAGAFASPFLYTYFLKLSSDPHSLWALIIEFVHPGIALWANIYWLFLLFFLITIVIIALIKFPPVLLSSDEKLGNWSSFKTLLTNKYVVFYFIALFAYVACEQGNANWMMQFLSTFHAIDTITTGPVVLSSYWILLAAGCVVGMLLLRYLHSKTVLLIFTILAILAFSVATLGGKTLSLYAFPMVGLFHSVMWPLILAMAMNSITKFHGSLSGILFAASSGGAFGSFMVGSIGDSYGLRIGLLFLFVCYAVILSVFFWSKATK